MLTKQISGPKTGNYCGPCLNDHVREKRTCVQKAKDLFFGNQFIHGPVCESCYRNTYTRKVNIDETTSLLIAVASNGHAYTRK